MSYYCGIDIGASTAKLVIVDKSAEIIAKAIKRSGVDYSVTAKELLRDILGQLSIDRSEIAGSMSTGYGRENVEWADARMTEIACHGRGAYHHFPRRITVIDIGAQDSKVILLDENGSRVNFKMNRKCAAGTGAFLEEMALRLSIDISDLNGLAEKSAKTITLSSFCTVFAATEVLAKIREGEKIEDIVCAAFRSVVQRIVEMQRVEGSLVLTGGVVAHNPFMGRLLGEAFDMEPLAAPDAQYTGAFGAALFALEKTRKG